MKFKILKGTETFEKLWALWERIHAADRKAQKLVQKIRKEMGLPWHFAEIEYAGAQSQLAGGIAAIVFDRKPEGWKAVGLPHRKMYYPKESNKDLLKEMRALPVLNTSELNDIVGFKGGMSVGEGMSFVLHRAPGIQWKKDLVLMEVPKGAKYTPPNADIIEILESEYVRLTEGKRKKETA